MSYKFITLHAGPTIAAFSIRSDVIGRIDTPAVHAPTWAKATIMLVNGRDEHVCETVEEVSSILNRALALVDATLH